MPKKDMILQVLNDHYKDSFTYIREYLKFRDRLFVLVLIVVTAMYVFINMPAESYTAINSIAKEKLSTNLNLNSQFIDSLLWFVLLSLVLRYYQTCITIEKQYNYLNYVEKELNSIIRKGMLFQREGKAYGVKYRLYPSLAHIIYTFVFPSLLLVITGYKIWVEVKTYPGSSINLFLDVIFYVIILVLIITYLISNHLKK